MKINIDFFSDLNNLSEALVSGVYKIVIEYNGREEVLYIGEGDTVLRRCAQQLDKIEQDPADFCLDSDIVEDENITLKCRLLKVVNREKSLERTRQIRKDKEGEIIRAQEKRPLIQSAPRHGREDAVDGFVIGHSHVIDFLKNSGRR